MMNVILSLLCIMQVHVECRHCPGKLSFSLQEVAPGCRALVAQCVQCQLLHIVA